MKLAYMYEHTHINTLYNGKPMQAISLWESACDVIEQREAKLEQLQNFEKSASDPSHLFAKGIIYMYT